MKKQQTTNVVDNLIELGLAQRIYNQQDRRVIQISITEKGREFLDQQIENGTQKLMKRLSVLDEKERETFFDAVEKINPILRELA